MKNLKYPSEDDVIEPSELTPEERFLGIKKEAVKKQKYQTLQAYDTFWAVQKKSIHEQDKLLSTPLDLSDPPQTQFESF